VGVGGKPLLPASWKQMSSSKYYGFCDTPDYPYGECVGVRSWKYPVKWRLSSVYWIPSMSVQTHIVIVFSIIVVILLPIESVTVLEACDAGFISLLLRTPKVIRDQKVCNMWDRNDSSKVCKGYRIPSNSPEAYTFLWPTDFSLTSVKFSELLYQKNP